MYDGSKVTGTENIVGSNVQKIHFQMGFALWQFAMLSYNESRRFMWAVLIVTKVIRQKPEDCSCLVHDCKNQPFPFKWSLKNDSLKVEPTLMRKTTHTK